MKKFILKADETSLYPVERLFGMPKDELDLRKAVSSLTLPMGGG